MMKKWIAILLCLGMLLASFATTALADDVIHITYWANTNEPSNDEELSTNFLAQYVKLFNEAHDNIEVEIVYNGTNWEDAMKKLTLSAASNSLPDVFDYTPDAAWGLPDAGVVVDLTDYLEADPEWTDRFAEGTFDLIKMIGNGRIYAVPYNTEVQGWFYNADLLAQYGLSVSEDMTWDEFLNILSTLKENGVTALAHGAIDTWSLWGFWNLYPQYGFLDEVASLRDGSLKFADSTSFRKTYERIYELGDLITRPENEATMTYTEAIEYFLSGQAAFLSSGSFTLSDTTNWNPGDFNVGFTYGPLVPDPATDAKYSCKVNGWLQFCGSSANESPEKMAAVIEFVKFLSDPSLTDLQVKCKSFPAVKGEMIDTSLYGDDSAIQSVLASMYDDRDICAPIAYYFDSSANSLLFNAHTNLLMHTTTVDDMLAEFDDWHEFYSTNG